MASLRLPSTASRHALDRAQEPSQTSSREAATESIMESPPSTISFDEPPPGLRDRYLPTSPVIEISDDEGGLSPVSRARLRNTGPRDYTYRRFYDQIEHAIAASPSPHEQRREETVDLSSAVDCYLKEIPRQFEVIIQQFDRLKEENHQLKERSSQVKRARNRHKEQVRMLKLRIEALRHQLDEQKKQGVLVCVYCRLTRTAWKMLGCGHMLCAGCVEDIKSQGPLYEYPCPQCKTPIKSCVDCFPNLVEL